MLQLLSEPLSEKEDLKGIFTSFLEGSILLQSVVQSQQKGAVSLSPNLCRHLLLSS